MTLFTVRNIISIVAGFNLAGPPFFLALQNAFTGDYGMAVFLGVVGVFGLLLPEYLMSRFIDKTIKNPAKKAGETITQTKSGMKDRTESMKERVESRAESADTQDTTDSEDGEQDADGETNSTNSMVYKDGSIEELFENTREIVSEKSNNVQEEVNKRRNT